MPRTKSNHRLRCVHVLISNVSYCHALGRRISTTTREGAIRHVYYGVQCIADIDGQGDVVASYTWGVGIDNLLAIAIGGETYYPLTDVQGTIWGYVEADNSIVARFEYDAWGNILSSTSSVPALATNRYRFQGREWSAATGHVNFRARWYDPVTGRWLSKDPIGLNGGLNLYAFCGNDPINWRDPYGLDKKKDKKERKAKKSLIDIIKLVFKSANEANQSAALPTTLSTALKGSEVAPHIAPVIGLGRKNAEAQALLSAEGAFDSESAITESERIDNEANKYRQSAQNLVE